MPPTRKSKGEKTLPLHEALKSIEEMVTKLESVDMPLEESLAYYERGVNLVRQAQAQLVQAEQKLTILSERENGQIAEEPMGTENDSDEAPP